MQVELSGEDVGVILESLEYSKQRIRDAQGTPYEVRKQNLDRIDSAAAKLRSARKS